MSEAVPEGGESGGHDGVVMIRVNGHSYPAKYASRCQTCRSKYRRQIEQAIINGYSYKKIIEEVVKPFENHSALGPPSYRSVTSHVSNGHMPIPYSAQRQIIEKRAKELGQSLDEGSHVVADALTIYRSIVQRGFMRLNSDAIQPSMADLLKALQLQYMLESEGGGDGVDEELWREALMEYMAIVQRNVDPTTLQRIGMELKASPVLQAISSRRQPVSGELES